MKLKFISLFLFETFFCCRLFAQESIPVRDNSFLVEEAFNQETGVVQHISNFLIDKNFENWLFNFTQEWPIKSEKHQLSFSIPFLFSKSELVAYDVLINYRYQLIGKNNFYLAPRISAVLPSGKSVHENGNTGFQINLPFSYELKSKFAFHANSGITELWRKESEQKVNTSVLYFGGSVIWLLHKNFNLMNEVVYLSTDVKSGDSKKNSENFIINPGFRAAINCKSGLQIVPGFSVPIDVSNNTQSYFLYVSFEHPFTKKKAD